MEKIRIAIEQRPNYYRHQLLLEDDFLAEQNYHVDARRHHNLNLYGWGVVHGLTVSRDGDTSLIINPGVAIDPSGHEIFVKRAQHISVAEFGPNELLQVGLSYEEDTGTRGNAGGPPKQRQFCAVISISKILGASTGLILARVQLDGQGKLDEKAISYSDTTYAKLVAPASIRSTELHESLRKGWLRLPFRPAPMIEGPEEGSEEGLPAFRVGATEARSPDPTGPNERDRGAAGTMAIPLAPNVTHIIRLRIAGLENQGEIIVRLIVGGWNRDRGEHVRKTILEETIPSERPFFREYPITNTSLDPEYNTLSLWLKGTRKTAVSLVAVEFVYYEAAR
jgi:hypothetical protein